MPFMIPDRPGHYQYEPGRGARHACINQSGGSIKTTSATILAACCARAGVPSVVWDLDTQCNASRILGYKYFSKKNVLTYAGEDPELAHLKDRPMLAKGRPYLPAEEAHTVFDVLAHEHDPVLTAKPARRRVGRGWGADAFEEIPNLHVVLGDRSMSSAELAISGRTGGSLWLRGASGKFSEDTVHFFDSPPTLGQLTTSIIIASDRILLCILPRSSKEDEGGEALMDTLHEIQESYGVFGVAPELAGVLVGDVNRLKGREEVNRVGTSKATLRAMKRIDQQYGPLVMPLIRKDARIPDQLDYECVLTELVPDSIGVEDYTAVARRLGLIP